jgi:hypothetical protein
MTWQIIPLSTSADLAESVALASGFFKAAGKWPYFQDVYWLLSWAKGKPEDVRLYANFVNGRISGIAGGIVEDCQIRIGFGSRIRLHTFRLKRLRLQEPLLCGLEGNEKSQRGELCHLFRQICRDNPSSPLYLEAIPVDSVTHDVLRSNLIRSSYLVQQYGFETARHVIDAPPTYGAYFDTIGRETRSGLRRSMKRLFTSFPQQVRLKKFCNRAEVDHFFSEVGKVVTETWQWQRGDNMSWTIIDKFKALSTSWADRGYLRNFILYVGDQPVSYIIGYRIADQFNLEATGYDSNWRKWAVGVACILLSLQAMLDEDPPIVRYDFLSWEFEYKKRLGNTKWMEANFYAFPYAFRSRVIYVCLRANIVAANRLRRFSHWPGPRIRFPAAASAAGIAQRPRSLGFLRD